MNYVTIMIEKDRLSIMVNVNGSTNAKYFLIKRTNIFLLNL